MTISTSILLIAVGAILKWAVTAHLSGSFRGSFGGGRGGGNMPPDEQDTRYLR